MVATDNGQFEESRVASEADCKWKDYNAEWDIVEPREFGFLLQVCEVRGIGRPGE